MNNRFFDVVVLGLIVCIIILFTLLLVNSIKEPIKCTNGTKTDLILMPQIIGNSVYMMPTPIVSCKESAK